jgi:hypothetical protein
MVVQQFGLELLDPIAVDPSGINPQCYIPYDVTSDHILSSLTDFADFLGFLNRQLITKSIPRLETFLMPASFSSLVGEFMNVRIPLFCPSVVKNRYHNGHPDLIPAGRFPGDAVQHSTVGIEVKGSRNRSGWQGHNPENVWLMVFVFDANSANDEADAVKKGTQPVPKPFRFVEVLGAQLELDDWQFSGRGDASRRTITATVKPSGYDKMAANWIYRDPSIRPPTPRRGARPLR